MASKKRPIPPACLPDTDLTTWFKIRPPGWPAVPEISVPVAVPPSADLWQECRASLANDFPKTMAGLSPGTNESLWQEDFWTQMRAYCARELADPPQAVEALERLSRLWSIAKELARHYRITATLPPEPQSAVNAAEHRAAVEALLRWCHRRGAEPEPPPGQPQNANSHKSKRRTPGKRRANAADHDPNLERRVMAAVEALGGKGAPNAEVARRVGIDEPEARRIRDQVRKRTAYHKQ